MKPLSIDIIQIIDEIDNIVSSSDVSSAQCAMRSKIAELSDNYGEDKVMDAICLGYLIQAKQNVGKKKSVVNL